MNFGRSFNPSAMYGITRNVKNGVNWSNLLSNTQKTLGVINQAIPVFYQIRPMFNNIRTIFKVAGVVNNINNTENNNDVNKNYTSQNIQDEKNIKYEKANYEYSDGPNFFI